MFGTVYHPLLPTLAHFDHVKAHLSLLILTIFKKFLTINLIYVYVCAYVYGQL